MLRSFLYLYCYLVCSNPHKKMLLLLSPNRKTTNGDYFFQNSHFSLRFDKKCCAMYDIIGVGGETALLIQLSTCLCRLIVEYWEFLLVLLLWMISEGTYLVGLVPDSFFLRELIIPFS